VAVGVSVNVTGRESVSDNTTLAVNVGVGVQVYMGIIVAQQVARIGGTGVAM